MDESQRKQLAERLHGYSSMPGIPEQIQNDLIQASVLIHTNKIQEEDEEKIQETIAEESISLKYLSQEGFDHIGYAEEVLRRYGSANFNSDGIDPTNQSR